MGLNASGHPVSGTPDITEVRVETKFQMDPASHQTAIVWVL